MKTLKILIFICVTMISCNLLAADFEKDTFHAKNGKEITITFFGHGTLMLTYGDYSIQIDPITQYADYSALPKADLLLITHEHGDHFDKKAVAILEKKETVLIVNSTVGKELGKGKILANGEQQTVTKDVTVAAVPAYNITKGRENFHKKGEGNGYIITLGGTRIYVAGDTEDIPELANLKDIEIAFLPVNQPYTMTVAQAIRAAKMFKPKVLYPYHFGDTPVAELVTGLRDSGIDVRIRKMR